MMKIRLIYFVISAISGLLPIIGLFIYLKINDPLVLYEKSDRMVFENEPSNLLFLFSKSGNLGYLSSPGALLNFSFSAVTKLYVSGLFLLMKLIN